MEAEDSRVMGPPCEMEEVEQLLTLTSSRTGLLLEEKVMSEVHIGCPPNVSGSHISHFSFYVAPNVLDCDVEPIEKVGQTDISGESSMLPGKIVDCDEDGDLIATRRQKLPGSFATITIQHNITSSIPNVGLQVWKAELVLADFILYRMFTSSELQGAVVIELGAGTGLVGILLARAAKTVFITDYGTEILDNCAQNVQLNYELFGSQSSVHVRELDWKSSWPPLLEEKNDISKRYYWSSSDVDDVYKATLLVAADVIYSDDLTDAFFSMLEKLMSLGSKKVLYLVLEKRYNFSLSDLDVVANGYSHFRSYMKEKDSEDTEDGSSPVFVGERMDLSVIPQYVREYDRGDDVELWKISYNG